MWSTVGRNFLSDGGFDYYPAKWATAEHYGPEDFYNSVMLGMAELANGGVTTVHNWSHNNRSPKHVDAELEAHRDSLLRARYSIGHVDRLPVDIVNTFEDLDRVQRDWFDDRSRLDGLVHLGVNLRGMVQSDARVFHVEMQDVLRRKLPVCIHASQTRPNSDDAADYEKRGYLGPHFLFCHYLAANDSDRAAMARTSTPLSFSTHSEMRLAENGDARSTCSRLERPASRCRCDTDTEQIPAIGFREVIAMATIDGAHALGLGDITGSLTPGKRADLIMIRTTDLNIAPLAQIETTIVQSATPANVDTVMIDGRIVKHGGHLTHFNVPEIVERAERSALRVRREAGGLLTPVSDAMGESNILRSVLII
jgi:5-methylthioadenosine/S-adenosylhomocysteine deaminase